MFTTTLYTTVNNFNNPLTLKGSTELSFQSYAISDASLSIVLDTFITTVFSNVVQYAEQVILDSHENDADKIYYIKFELKWKNNDLDIISKRGFDISKLVFGDSNYLLFLLDNADNFREEFASIIIQHRTVFATTLNLLSILDETPGNSSRSLADDAMVSSLHYEVNRNINHMAEDMLKLFKTHDSAVLREKYFSHEYKKSGLSQQVSGIFNNINM